MTRENTVANAKWTGHRRTLTIIRLLHQNARSAEGERALIRSAAYYKLRAVANFRYVAFSTELRRFRCLPDLVFF